MYFICVILNLIKDKELIEITCWLREEIVGCRNCVSNSKHICNEADANFFLELPVYSDKKNEKGTYSLVDWRKFDVKN